MARVSGTEPILDAAREWRERCLVGTGSVLSDEALWTTAHVDELNRHFVENLDAGAGTFVDRLMVQLAPASPGAKKLAAEMLWLMMLFPNNIGREAKLQLISTVWAWSGEPFPRDHELLERPFYRGVGSGGPGYGANRAAELVFVVLMMRDWRRRPAQEQQRLLADGWRFAAWLDTVPGAANRQFRHMILHLLFPERFERISSTTDKRRVDTTLAYLRQDEPASAEASGTGPLARDHRIFLIRRAAEKRFPGQEIDFYCDPLESLWRDSDDEPQPQPTPGGSHVPPVPPAPEPPEAYVEPPFAEVAAAIRRQGMRVDDGVLRRYHLALRVRGFVILAGVSGTGKTWLAEAYARAAGARHLVVPVAPNWTTNEDLLGYLNPIDTQYHDTPFSRFLREASAEFVRAREHDVAPRPFHLVLDEMNLARVEYYFARFLSAMEQRAREGTAEIELAANDAVLLPPNLLFVGTVNVDETTHGFADKVFDRAQLIELEAGRDAMQAHLGEAGHGPLLLEVWDAVREVAPFAFRVADEIARYVEAGTRHGSALEELLDEQLLQKVLPKIKGTDPRVGAALERLEMLAEDRFPLTHGKVRRMRDDFQQHGFASYF